MARTTTDLLNSVKRRAQLPDDSGTLSDTDILEFASDELLNVVAPRLMAINEWHYAYSYNETVTSVRTYRINSRTVGNKIISVEFYDGTTYRTIRLKHPLTQRMDLGESYSIYGNQIVLSDACPNSGTLRIRAMLRPSRLVASGCSAITAVNTGTNSVTVDVDNFSDAQLVDVIYASSPYEVAISATIASGGAGLTYVLTGATVASAYALTTRLTPTEQTDRPQIPDELHDYLAQRVAIRCMEARGFTADMQNHMKKLVDLETAFDRLTSPRSSGEFKAIVPEEYLFGEF